jgi:rhodanese-related sulfurtransferase
VRDPSIGALKSSELFKHQPLATKVARLKGEEFFCMPIEIRRKDVKTLVTQGRAQLVEVLPEAEYKKEHLPQAINIPLQNITADSTRVLRKDVAVIVYCADFQCDLSARAGWRLESMGFQEVYRYTPGKADWLAAGWETEGTQAKKTRIRQMIHRDVPTCSLRERLEDVKSRRRPNQDLCVVVNDRNIVLGVIQGEAWNANPQARVVDVMHPGPKTLRPDLEPKDAQRLLRNYEAPSAIVTTSDGELLGIIRIAQKKSQKANKAA